MIANKMSIVATVASLVALCATEVAACPICVPYPKTTLADVFIESESIVLVREDNERPYVFRPLRVLKGTVDGPDIDAFIDSASRRRLKQNPDDFAVLVRETADDAWIYRCYATTDTQEFIRAIVEESTGWTGPRGSGRRVAFFTEHLTDPGPLIRNQAYLEVGRAPYAVIKTIAEAVPRDQILEFLANWRLVEWHNLFILMLGQSELPSDHDMIRNQFERRARFGIAINLSAWTTAYIETNPETGIEDVEELYLAMDRRTPDELEEVHRSLSVLGSEGGAVAEPRVARRRRRIVGSYAILLEHHPTLAGKVASDLTNWRTQALVGQLSSIVEGETELDPGSKMAVSYYLSMAPRFRSLN
jgi:hypothetical protein